MELRMNPSNERDIKSVYTSICLESQNGNTG